MATPSLALVPSGYKAGKLYSVLPTPVYGAEEVTNGDFATDTDWIKASGVTISGGLANADATASGNILRQSLTTLNASILYKYEFTISNYVSGNIKFSSFGGSVNANANGTHTAYGYPSDVSNMVLFGTFEGSIDNVSISEVPTVESLECVTT